MDNAEITYCRSNYDGLRLIPSSLFSHQYISIVLLSATAHIAKLRKEIMGGLVVLLCARSDNLSETAAAIYAK